VNPNDNKPKRLGGGVSGLFTAPGKPAPSTTPAAAPTVRAAETVAPIEEVHPNKGQPRTHFDDAALEELAASIRSVGVLEPILVRKRPQGGYEIIAGERRWRAAQRAGLHEVPIFVRDLSSAAAFEAAIIENLQREDLNPIETARAFARLVEEHKHSQDTIAQRVGKDRSTVANALRLLKLPKEVLTLIESGELSEGHGRALLTASDPATMIALAKQAIAQGWSVRETERRARGEKPSKAAPAAKPKTANVRDLENRLSKKLGSPVAIEDREGKGRIEIRYASLDELDRLLAVLTR
jgi:ParB family chromosome partitioning protein